MRVAARTTWPCALAVVLAASPAHASGGLDLIPDLQTLLINFAVLLLLIYPVNRLLLQPLVAVLQEREARTSGATERAERLADEAADARRTVEQRLQAARSDAQARRAAILAQADQEERQLIGAAREEAGREIDAGRASVADELRQASAALKDDARGLAREAASRILGREL